MSPEQRLLKYFEQISEAPDAVARLRSFVITLGVRGFFAEPGSVRDWRDCTLSDCATVWNGRAYAMPELLSSGTPIVRIQNLNGSNAWYYSNLELEPEKYCDGGDLLYAWSGTFGPYIWEGGKSIFHYHIWKMDVRDSVDKRFLFYLLKDLTEAIKAEAHGLMLPHMTKKRMEDWPVKLPLLAEQGRIVAKVGELMALCDELEAAQAKRERRRDRLVAAALHGLNNGYEGQETGEQASFQENARFYLNHLSKMTVRPEHVQQLRQTILNLAVRGKLVEQEPEDEPAGELLKRIQQARMKPVQGKGNADAPGQSFAVPPGWEAVRFEQILLHLQTGPFGSVLHQHDYEKGGTPVVNPASMRDGRVVPIDEMAVGEDTLERLAAYKLQVGDVVMGRRGEMGRCAVVTEREAGWLCGTGSLLLRFTEDISSRFVVTLMSAPSVREYLGGSSVGATMQNLNQSILRHMPIGLPPLAEQRRIVGRVDELMGFCDELEARLELRTVARSRLLEAALHEAFCC